MFILTFWVKDVPQPVVMRYTDRDRALHVLQEFRSAPIPGTVDLTDDFEARASLPRGLTLLPIYTDVAKDIEAQIEIQLAQQRANASLQTRMQTDPALKLHNGLLRPGLVLPQ